MKLIKTLCISAALLASSAAFATLISVGSLSRDLDDTNGVITDSLNHRTWLGFDITKGLTYAQTLAATQAGGQYSGYSVAHSLDVEMFLNAMLGADNMCITPSIMYCVYGNDSNRNKLVGDSWYLAGEIPYANVDMAFYLNDNPGAPVKLLGIEDYTALSQPDMVYLGNLGSIADADMVGASNTPAYPVLVGWLLYRDSAVTSNDVPEPGTLALVATALLGVRVLRRRQK